MTGGLSWRRAFALALAALLFLALNTGANLIYLLLALLAAHALIARLRLVSAAAEVEFVRALSDRAVAGEPLPVTLRAVNRGRRTHALLRAAERPPADAPDGEQEFWFAGLAPGTSLETRYTVTPARRGMLLLPPTRLSVPAAFELSRPFEGRDLAYTLVHPRAAPPPNLPDGFAAALGLASLDLPGDADFAGLSRAPLGERASRIHWRSYAKSGELHRKVFREHGADSLLLFLLAADPFAVDRGAELSAGIARALRAEGVRFDFASLGEKLSRRIDGTDARALLDHLALLAPRTIPLAADRAVAAIASFRRPRVLALVPASHPEPDDAFRTACGADCTLHILRYAGDPPDAMGGAG